MKHKIQLLVIIPARSQSKKLKNKNIRLLNITFENMVKILIMGSKIKLRFFTFGFIII